jgi:hypothetical protein
LDAYVYWTGADRLVVLDIEGVWRIWEELAHPLRNSELMGAARGILAGEDALPLAEVSSKVHCLECTPRRFDGLEYTKISSSIKTDDGSR